MWSRKLEPVDYSQACVSCGCSSLLPMHSFAATKELLLNYNFASYVGEFIEYKFNEFPLESVVLKWVPTDGIKLFSSPDVDYATTAKLLKFLELKFHKAQECNENE